MNIFRSFIIRYKTFIFFFLRYILILLIPLVSGILTYNVIHTTVKESVVRGNMAIIEQTRDIIDSQLVSLSNMVNQLAINTKINYLLSSGNTTPGSALYKAWDIRRDLIPYNLTGEFFQYFFVYFRKSDLFITPSTSYSSRFYDTFFNYGTMEYDEWRDAFLENPSNGTFMPATDVKFEIYEFTAIPYVQSLPIGFSGIPSGVIFIMIDEAKLHDMLKKMVFNQNGLIYIEDGKGSIITQIGDKRNNLLLNKQKYSGPDGFVEKQIDGQIMSIIHISSKVNDWNYTAVIPSEKVLSKVDYVQNVSLFILLQSVLIGLILAFVLSYFNMKPLKELAKTLSSRLSGDDKKNIDEFSFIKQHVDTVILKNKTLQESIEEQRPFVKAAFFDLLLKGTYRTEKNITQVLSHIDFTASGRHFLILLIGIEFKSTGSTPGAIEEIEAVRMILVDFLEQKSKTEVFLQTMDEKSIAVLLNYRENNISDLYHQSEMLAKETTSFLHDRYGLKLYLAAGEIYENVTQIPRSYEEAKQVFDLLSIHNDGRYIHWYKDIIHDIDMFYFPIETEERILNLARSGKHEEISSLLNEIYHENVIKLDIAPQMCQQLMFTIRGTFLRFAGRTVSKDRLNDYLNEIDNSTEINSFFRTITGKFTEVCGAVKTSWNNKGSLSIEEILKYINNNFSRNDMSLCSLSTKFKVSEPYISDFFKVKTGENFYPYLEKMRIKEAVLLLDNEEKSIKDIAEAVGYTSDKSFRRAFKRVKSISPSDYRRLNKAKN